MNNQEKYVLAMYDVRGKQAFIFRTNKLKEIVGGSAVIRDCFEDYLFPAAIEYRNKLEGTPNCLEPAIYTYNPNNPEAFCGVKFQERMSGEKFIGEVVYNGGGNFLVLYKNKTIFQEVNKIFTKKLLENVDTLNVLCTCVETSDANLTNYEEDNKRLYREHEKLENSESKTRTVNGIPFVQIDAMTSMPIVYKETLNGAREQYTCESLAKIKKYKEISNQNEAKKIYGTLILDDIVKEKGEDSLLAVVFIDGNNMGAKVQNLFNNDNDYSYNHRVTKLREFSAKIQKQYVDERKKDIDEKIQKKKGKKRSVVFAGDEMSFIVKAEDALDAVEAYFENLPEGDSSCAGIAIFHSHAPYADAYKIAEECCENGKKYMKDHGQTGTCYMDFHYCRSGMGMNLDSIREKETGSLISKPWLIKIDKEEKSEAVTLEEINKIVEELNSIGSRTNVKTLIGAAEKSLVDFDMEMERIYSHQKEEIKEKIKHTFRKLEGEERRRLIYDIISVYDIWFRKEEV